MTAYFKTEIYHTNIAHVLIDQEKESQLTCEREL